LDHYWKSEAKESRMKIQNALKIIEQMEEILEKERVDFLKEDKNDSIDSLAKTFFSLEKTQLEKLKETLS
jgi:hypothetical protein